jgi:hypothetical protein
MLSSCPLHVTRVCSLAAVLRPSAAAATGSAAFGRAGAFDARWHLHCHAIVSSRAVESCASARSQALEATCVSRKRYQVHGDASFCAERKIPTNIAGISHRSVQGFREQMPRRPNRPSTDKIQTRHINSEKRTTLVYFTATPPLLSRGANLAKSSTIETEKAALCPTTN